MKLNYAEQWKNHITTEINKEIEFIDSEID